MSTYPGAIPSFTDPRNPTTGGVDDPAADGSATDATVIVAKIHAELRAALVELGTNPKAAAASVAARFTALDSTVAGKADGSATTAALASKADLVGGVLPTSQLPAIAVVEFLGSVASQAAMLALSGQKGDWCIRTDQSKVFVITGPDQTQLSSWTSMAYPSAPVTTVNGQTGAVTLAAADVGAMTNPMTADSDLVVGGPAGAPARLAKGVNGSVLAVTGGALNFVSLATSLLADWPDSPAAGTYRLEFYDDGDGNTILQWTDQPSDIMPTGRIRGRASVGSGAIENLTIAQVAALLAGTSSTTLAVGNHGHAAVPSVPSGRWYHWPGQITTAATVLNTMRLYPVRLAVQQHTDMQLEVTSAGTAGALLRLGFYANDASLGVFPNITAGPLLDAGTIAADTTGVKNWGSLTFTPPSELVWLAVVSQVALCTLRALTATPVVDVPLTLPSGTTPGSNSARMGLAIASVSGALPSSGTVVGDNSLAPKVFFKVA